MLALKEVIVLLSIIYGISAVRLNNEESRNNTQRNLRRFPANFMFGAATSSYQIEGGWNEGGKGWSMWDHLVRTDPGHIADRSTGDIAANSYHFYKRDVEMLKELGVSIYRFSISWPRILPFGRHDYVNPEGVAYYNNLINELLANGITPFVTIYHWELPQNLNEQGGWLTENIVDWFGDYARVLYRNFGDRVKHWLTINEPYIHCNHGYSRGIHAPRIRSPGIAFYECGRHILLAHARAYHIYKNEFAFQGGQVAIVISSDMSMPSDDSQSSYEAMEDYRAFYVGQYMDPIFSATGNYPQRLIDRVAQASANQGLSESRLRPFTQEQIDYIRGTSDFLALNHYTSKFVYRNDSLNGTFEVPSHQDDAYLGTYPDPSWMQGGTWLFAYPPGLNKLLVHFKEKYNNLTVYVTENGFGNWTTGLVDENRVTYLRGYINSLLDAIDAGVDIRGYCAWSLMDNFEWATGYTMRFGLYQVDFDDANRTRTPRKSALVYKEIIRSRVIDPTYNPDPNAKDDSNSAIVVKTSALFILLSAFVNTLF
ncbi:unnamed protein product [Colias eurytheme]|nr:unnamed protein product [Colias eurytheme]